MTSVRVQVVYPLILLGFFAIIVGNGWFRPEHLLVPLMITLCIIPRTSDFTDKMVPLAAVGILYDLQKLVNFEMPVHVSGPYLLEKHLFGGGMTPNEFFEIHNNALVDVLTAVPYLTYIVYAIAFGMFLYFRDKEKCQRYGLAFLSVNVAGLLTEMIFPVAPPWYVARYGLGPVVHQVTAYPAGALRFDQLTGTHIFQSLYGRATDVFGAIPSLHVTYPLLVLFFAWELRSRWLIGIALAYSLLMNFAAVYLQHHYVIDVVIGLGYATAAYVVVNWVMGRVRERAEEKVAKVLTA